VTPRTATPIAAGLCALLLAACGSSGGIARATAPPLPDTTGPPTATPAPSATATPSPSPTPTPLATPTPAEGGVIRVPYDDQQGDNTVAADLYPSSGFANCPSMGPAGYGACPVTQRLADRLNAHPIKGVEPLCRCQQQWQGVTINAPPVLPAITTYTVEVDLSFGGGTTIKFDLTVLRNPDGWYADDIRCHGGDSSTSIYASSPPLCGS
jgi:hypothetical protein